MTEMVIARRFCGPPSSGNGGYVCGMLARHLGAGAASEITLRRPPPLDRPLQVRRRPDGQVELCDADQVLASGALASVDVGDVPPATLADAEAAQKHSPFADPAKHGLPGCFVCGPARAPGDGMRIFCGPVVRAAAPDVTTLAAVWTPGADLEGSDGKVAPEFVWSALDCPTGFAGATAREHGMTGEEFVLLGRMAARIETLPRVGQPCAVIAWATGRDGRKIFANAALRDSDGQVVAVARATWIMVDRQSVIGSP